MIKSTLPPHPRPLPPGERRYLLPIEKEEDVRLTIKAKSDT
jgi:hypothetical protein